MRSVVSTQDVFGLNVGQWYGLPPDEQVRVFQQWLKTRVDLMAQSEEQLWSEFIADGYKRGVNRAFDDTDKGGRSFTKLGFLALLLGGKRGAETLRLLARKAFLAFRGVLDTLMSKMAHTVMDALMGKASGRSLAAQLAGDIQSVGQVRSEIVARTELVRAFAEGQLQAMEHLGKTHVSVMAEWYTAGDDRVCQRCASMDGKVIPIKLAHNMIPQHPLCRCAWIPVNG